MQRESFLGCMQCKNTQLTSRVLYMLSANGSSSFIVLLVLFVLLVPLGCLVLKFCWFSSSFGSLILLVHKFCWFGSYVGSLVLLVR